MMSSILIVEDDITFGMMLKTWLGKKGFEVSSVSNIARARKHIESQNVDLILSDLRLPDHEGIDLLKWMNEQGMDIPLIIMTGYADIQSAVQAMKLGARDYITKPFSVEELLARIRVTQRRLAVMQSGEQIESSVFENGGLKIDYTAGCTYLKGEELHLTPIEYKLLCLLSRNVGKVLTHTYITQQIWGRCSDNDVASLRVFMATLRKKLEPEKNGVQYIQTHIGIGYRMLRIEK